MAQRGTLIVYVKPPLIGLAKTRLAKGLGRAEARRIAGFTLARTLRAAQLSGMDITLAIAPDSLIGAAHWPRGMARASQGRGTLTERLGKGLRDAPPGPVFFIGADAPDISAADLRHAARALKRYDAVFGPARDGGFWLFGLNKGPRTRAPFSGVRWSGPHALADVKERLPAGVRVKMLRMLIDIDEAADWRDWTAGTVRQPAIAPCASPRDEAAARADARLRHENYSQE